MLFELLNIIKANHGGIGNYGECLNRMFFLETNNGGNEGVAFKSVSFIHLVGNGETLFCHHQSNNNNRLTNLLFFAKTVLPKTFFNNVSLLIKFVLILCK